MDYTSLIRKLLKAADWTSEYYECTDEGFEITSDLFSLDVFINPETSYWHFSYDNDERGYSDEYVEGKGWNDLVDALFEMDIPGLEFLEPSEFYGSSDQWAIWCETDEDFSGYVGDNDNYEDFEDFLHDRCLFSSEDEAQDFINNDPVLQAHIELGDAEYRPVNVSQELKLLEESQEDEEEPEKTSILSIEFWDEEEGDWDEDLFGGPVVKGNIEVKVNFKNNQTGSTWATVYKIPASGRPVGFSYSPARITADPYYSSPAEIEWDHVDWDNLEIDDLEWVEDLTSFPEEEYTDEEYENLVGKLQDLLVKYEDKILERKSVNF